MNSESLIHRYLLGDITEQEVQHLDQLLADDPKLRREFAFAAAVDAGLRDVAIEGDIQSTQRKAQPKPPRQFLWAMLGLAAAAVVVIFAVNVLWPRQEAVATLASSENAAWESHLPTVPGSELTPGLLNLKSGVATIQFHSGAEVVLEAPAELEILTPKRAHLLSGAAMIEVPKRAIGFTLETPDGYAVDYGTQFAVRVDRQKQESSFEIIEGEIAVHQPTTGEEVRLIGQGKSARVSARSLIVSDTLQQDDAVGPEFGFRDSDPVLRVGTNGRTESVIRNNKRKKYIDRDVLSVKTTELAKWDQRSFFEFDLSGVDFREVRAARLRLNLIPSTRGFASRLPKINRFGVYGLTNHSKADWKRDSLWEEAPAPEDGILLGTFEIPRSQQRGSFGIENQDLLNFLKEPPSERITLILVRETTQIEGTGPGLTHMFASDTHPEAVGPMLEFSRR